MPGTSVFDDSVNAIAADNKKQEEKAAAQVKVVGDFNRAQQSSSIVQPPAANDFSNSLQATHVSPSSESVRAPSPFVSGSGQLETAVEHVQPESNERGVPLRESIVLTAKKHPVKVTLMTLLEILFIALLILGCAFPGTLLGILGISATATAAYYFVIALLYIVENFILFKYAKKLWNDVVDKFYRTEMEPRVKDTIREHIRTEHLPTVIAVTNALIKADKASAKGNDLDDELQREKIKTEKEQAKLLQVQRAAILARSSAGSLPEVSQADFQDTPALVRQLSGHRKEDQKQMEDEIAATKLAINKLIDSCNEKLAVFPSILGGSADVTKAAAEDEREKQYQLAKKANRYNIPLMDPGSDDHAATAKEIINKDILCCVDKYPSRETIAGLQDLAELQSLQTYFEQRKKSIDNQILFIINQKVFNKEQKEYRKYLRHEITSTSEPNTLFTPKRPAQPARTRSSVAKRLIFRE